MPHVDARAWFSSKPAAELARLAAQGSAMQGGYLMLAARALGLDCGPIGRPRGTLSAESPTVIW